MVVFMVPQWLWGISDVIPALLMAFAVANSGGVALLLLSVLTPCHSLHPLQPAVRAHVPVSA